MISCKITTLAKHGCLMFLLVLCEGCLQHEFGAAPDQMLSVVSPEAASEPFMIVLLPDTQYYSLKDPATYRAQTKWIADNRDRCNIKFVIHLGDITHENTLAEWNAAFDAHSLLGNARIPYSVVPGNHDNPKGGHVRDTSKYNRFFGPEKFEDKDWYGGHFGETNDSSYAYFEAAGLEFMVVNLEFAPRKDVLCWADRLIGNHPNHRVIIATHCYQGADGEHHTGCAAQYHISGSGGDVVWDELVRRHSNMFLVVSGHVGDSELKVRKGDAGNTVYEILTDYQFEKRDLNGDGKLGDKENHGNGWLRTLTFLPSDDEIHIETFSVLDGVAEFNYTEQYPSDPEHYVHSYSLEYDMSAPIR